MTHNKLESGTHLLTEEEIERIVQRYDTNEVRLSTAYEDGGIDPLWRRFARAVTNQADAGDATLARYAIWANTVRDNVIQAMEAMEAGQEDEAMRLMIRAVNSLSAFSDVQAFFDPFRVGEGR